MKQTCTWVRFAFFVAWSVAVCSLAVEKAIPPNCAATAAVPAAIEGC